MSQIVIKIRPAKSSFDLNLSEIWRYRELFYIFAWRDIKIRYKQTLLGVLWVILQPIAQMILFTFFFGKIAKIPTGELPYFLFVLIGLVYWNYFANTLSQASNSLIENENIIKKVYFPKLILPLSSSVTGTIDFLINFSILLLVAIYFGFIPNLLFLIAGIIGFIITGLSAGGLGLLLSAFNVKYRDIRYVLPFLIQLLLFLTPIIYPLALVKGLNKFLLSLNPLTGVIEIQRQILAGESVLDWFSLEVGVISMLVIFVIGLGYFKSTERYFADVV